MAVDIKSLLTNKWLLTAVGGGGGFFAGRKFIKKNHGGVYGALGGAIAGYVVGKMLEPKAAPALTAEQIQAAAAQIAAQPQTQIQGDLGEFVDIDDAFDTEPIAVAPPGASAYVRRAAQVQREAAAALRQPPRGDVANTEDLSGEWSGQAGSLGGGLGEYASDAELDELIAQANGGRRGN